MNPFLCQAERSRTRDPREFAAVIVRDRHGTIRYWSIGCERLFGFAAADAVGQRCYELLQTQADGLPLEKIDDALFREGEWTGELSHCRRDGSRIWVLAHLALLSNPEGSGEEVLENCIDATIQHLAISSIPPLQAKARNDTERLEAQVAALRQQLAHAQKMETIGQMAAGVVHDLNNFLAVAMANAEQLHASAEGAGNGRDAHRAAMIERAVERGAHLANQLLAFARRGGVAPAVTKVEPLIAGMLELLHRAAGSGNELRTRYEADIWNIRIEPTQLESALLNLVINARDAISGGHGTIDITVENVVLTLVAAIRLRLPPGEFVRITVADNGIGIAPDVRERVLEPFFTTKPAGKGTGLGLTQVHGFVGQSGGGLDIWSEPGHGTKVSLLLPREPDEGGGPREESANAGNGAPHRSVLIVESQDDLRDTARRSLEARGYVVREAKDAADARTILASGDAVSVLLVDVVLPGGVSGVDLAREARRLQPGIGVLLTSGYTTDPSGRSVGSTHDVEVLLRPYVAGKLAARIRKLAAGVVPPPLMWSSAHKVGIPEIDEQHARLGRLLNDLATVLGDGGDHEAALGRVIHYAEFHFAAEEQLMSERGYSGLAAHAETHRRLLDEIRGFHPGVDAVSVNLALDYLQEWLLRHVDGEDRQMAEGLSA